ncbi:MAG: nickel-dependent lactate racemase [Lachnospiraceae bacterium]|nr:nickel-dependent lactate racemase [Lachnospiraceae bacterium]
MDAKICLGYGEEQVEFEISGAASVETILPNPMEEITDLKAAFVHSIEDGVIDGKPLAEAIGSGDDVTIVVSDVTRSWMHQDQVMPLLVDYLHDKIGVAYEKIVVLIAVGTHRHSTPQELVKICSQKVVDRVRVVDHDCDAPDLVYVGTTSRSTEVRVNPLVVGRRVIVMGGTVHHMMAGFGGGRKNLLPGVSGRDSIRQNHRRALDPEKAMTDARVGCCKLTDNPIHEDMMEAAHLVHADFGINLVVAASGIHSGIFSGEMDAAWEASCDFQRKCYEIEVKEPADIVLCSSGGAPKDMNLYQGCKGMLNAMRALKPGGTMLWTCKCPEGGGAPDYFSWLKPLQEGHLDASLRADFTIGGYIFYLTVEQLNKAGHVYTLTELDPEMVRPMGMEASSDLAALVKKIDFSGKKVYVLPYAGSVVPV